MKYRCEVCRDKGFVIEQEEHAIKTMTMVVPCPACNPDSGYAPGQYEAELVAKHGRCDNGRGGGGRTCYRYKGHTGDCVFECGK
jgi:hypothetical protein